MSVPVRTLATLIMTVCVQSELLAITVKRVSIVYLYTFDFHAIIDINRYHMWMSGEP